MLYSWPMYARDRVQAHNIPFPFFEPGWLIISCLIAKMITDVDDIPFLYLPGQHFFNTYRERGICHASFQRRYLRDQQLHICLPPDLLICQRAEIRPLFCLQDIPCTCEVQHVIMNPFPILLIGIILIFSFSGVPSFDCLCLLSLLFHGSDCGKYIFKFFQHFPIHLPKAPSQCEQKCRDSCQ